VVVGVGAKADHVPHASGTTSLVYDRLGQPDYGVGIRGSQTDTRTLESQLQDEKDEYVH
jgi:hypothetical protein